MPAYSELSLLLAVTALSPLKYEYEFPASENTHISKYKAEDTSSNFLRNVRMCQLYNVISQNVMLNFTAVRTSDIREQDQFVYCN